MGTSTISMVIFNSYVKLPEAKRGGFLINTDHVAVRRKSAHESTRRCSRTGSLGTEGWGGWGINPQEMAMSMAIQIGNHGF
jgi:hypothetical protein